MTKNKLLKETVKQKGVMYSHIASELGITKQCFSGKMNGKTDFKLTEIKKMRNILHLSDEELIRIFFGSDVAPK